MVEPTSIAQDTTGSVRFSTHAREFLIEVSFSKPNSSVIVSLHENGRLLHSEMRPALTNDENRDNGEYLTEIARSIRAQLEEMYMFLDDLHDRPDTRLTSLLADIFASRGINDEADRLYKSAQELSPRDDRSFYKDGGILMESGLYAESAEKFSCAVRLKPLYADYRNGLGLALVWAGRVSEGCEQLAQALEINTYFADAHYSSGLAYLFNGIKGIDKEIARDFVSKSRAMFEKAALIDAIFNAKEYQTALRLLAEGKLESAFGAFKRNRDWVLKQKAPAYDELRSEYLLRVKHCDREAVEGSISSLSEQLEKNPGFTDLSYRLAVGYLKRSICDWRTGVEQFKQTLEQNPDLQKCIDGYDLAYLMLNDLEKAVEMMEKSDHHSAN